jgi:cAMP-specific phosphodiesterase 4
MIFPSDKQQELDIPVFRSGDDPNSELQGTSGISKLRDRQRSPGGGPPMSQISGFKKPLQHKNSFTSDRLPRFGVETTPANEAGLGAMLNDIDVWGIDIFKIRSLSSNRPLTCIAYSVFQVRIQDLRIKTLKHKLYLNQLFCFNRNAIFLAN